AVARGAELHLLSSFAKARPVVPLRWRAAYVAHHFSKRQGGRGDENAAPKTTREGSPSVESEYNFTAGIGGDRGPSCPTSLYNDRRVAASLRNGTNALNSSPAPKAKWP